MLPVPASLSDTFVSRRFDHATDNANPPGAGALDAPATPLFSIRTATFLDHGGRARTCSDRPEALTATAANLRVHLRGRWSLVRIRAQRRDESSDGGQDRRSLSLGSPKHGARGTRWDVQRLVACSNEAYITVELSLRGSCSSKRALATSPRVQIRSQRDSMGRAADVRFEHGSGRTGGLHGAKPRALPRA